MRMVDLRDRLRGTPRIVAPPGLRLAPGPEGDPILGNYRHLLSDPLGFFLRLRREYGDVVKIRFAMVDAHLIADPALVRTILAERHRNYGKETRGIAALKLVLGNGLLTSTGDFWLRQRRIAQPAFHKRRLDGFTDVFVQAAADAATNLRVGEDVDVHREMMRLTLRIVAETLLGADVSRDADVVGDAVSYIVEVVNDRARGPFNLPIDLPLPHHVRFRKHLAELDRIVYGFIGERRRTGTKRDDLLGLLMDARDPDTGEQMTDTQLRDEVMTIFLAGHETTANALTWTFHLLGHHPTVRARLEAELDEVLGDRLPTVDDAPRLVYAKQVIDEAMRLYPPAWMIARSVTEDDDLNGYFIPAGSIVMLSPWVMHRHPSLYRDPEGFDPDRFAEGKEAKRERFAYFPFGGGPHLCIGQGFAQLEAQLALATIAQRVRFESIPGIDVEPEPMVTLRPKRGIPMTVRARR